MKIVLLGPPGSGKGTQANLICQKYNIPHISTGDIFRKNISEKTELGVLANTYISQGQLVPDDVTISIVEDRLKQDDCKNGFILDGFPRNLYQAQALDKITNIDKAIMIDLADEIIISRLLKRRMCKDCGNSTLVDWLIDGKCEKCGGEVYQRQDDTAETIQKRLDNQKLPANVVEFYKDKKIFYNVEPKDSVDETFVEVEKVLKGN